MKMMEEIVRAAIILAKVATTLLLATPVSQSPTTGNSKLKPNSAVVKMDILMMAPINFANLATIPAQLAPTVPNAPLATVVIFDLMLKVPSRAPALKSIMIILFSCVWLAHTLVKPVAAAQSA